MGKKMGMLCMIMGAVLMGSALLAFLWNEEESRQAGVHSSRAIQALQQMQTLPTPTDPTDSPEESQIQPEPTEAEKLTVVSIEGYDYIGTLTIPALELALPVQADWSEEGLEVSPCRHFGSPVTNDFVIAAHNYVTHFAYLYKLNPGDTVTFTDMNGSVTQYAVDHLQKISPTDVETVQNSGYDLVLYTCTYGSEGRRAVFCSRTENSGGD